MASTYLFSENYNGHDIVTNIYLNTGINYTDNGRGQQVPERTHTVIVSDDLVPVIQEGVRSDALIRTVSDMQTAVKALIDNVDDPVLIGQITGAGFVEATALAAPGGFAAVQSGPGIIILNWLNDVAADGYEIARSLDSAFADGTETEVYNGVYNSGMSDLGLTTGVTYYYRIVAYGSATTSLPSFANQTAP